MRRINTATARNGRFVNGNKTTGTKATQFNAEWCNTLQEEIANLIEASGLSLDGSENQLKRLFTSLFMLDATLKSATLRKGFSGGYSDAVIDGEKIRMEAAGESVTDPSCSELSRMRLLLQKSERSGSARRVEITPTGLVVSGTPRVGNEVKTEISEDTVETENISLNYLKIKTIIDVNSSSYRLTTREAEVGDVVVIRNVNSSDVEVEIHVIRESTAGWATKNWTIVLKEHSSMMLICSAIHDVHDTLSYEWSPLSNTEVSVNNLM